jgi:hypothetical protein
MAPVIRIDDEVMNELKKKAVNLGLVFEPPNTTLRRILGLDMENPLSSSDMKALAAKIVQDTLAKHGMNKNVIELKLNASSRKYVYIPLPKDKRLFFPGYKVDFELETDGETLMAHVTAEPNGESVNVGDPHAGTHIRGKFGPWYARHPELKVGDKLQIESLEAGKRYKLSIVSK